MKNFSELVLMDISNDYCCKIYSLFDQGRLPDQVANIIEVFWRNGLISPIYKHNFSGPSIPSKLEHVRPSFSIEQLK